MRLGSALIAAAAGAAALGCGFNQEGIPPAQSQIFYPGGIEVDPGGRWLYVVNSNADLRFNDGTLAVVDLQAAHDDLMSAHDTNPGSAGPREVCPTIGFFNPLSGPKDYCCWDALDHNVLDCDERQYVRDTVTVKVGSFGSAIQVLPTPLGDGARVLVAVRGNSSVTWIKATYQTGDAAPALTCTTAAPKAGSFVECDEDHRVDQTTNPPGPTVEVSPAVLLPEEPYALALDEEQLLLYVGHLRGGFLSSIDLSVRTGGAKTYGVADLDASPPTLIGTFPGIFSGDFNGSAGVTSLTVTSTGINTGRVYAASRFLPRAGAFAPVSLGDPMQRPPEQVNRDTFLANAGDVFVSPLPGAEIRGIQFIPGIPRAFLLQRTPPALVAFDTSTPQDPRPTDVIEMCNGPTFLHMHNATGAEGREQLFVTCFESGQVYVVDPFIPKLVTIIEVGRGPSGLAFSRTDPTVAYVDGFGSNNVSVIDLDPLSDTRYHVVQRIGFANPVPR